MGFLVWLLAIIGAIAILWKVSSIARWFIKWTLFIIVSLVSATLPIPVMLLKPRDPRNALIPAAALRVFCNLLGIKVTVEGHENIIKDSGCVVLINHQSQLDLLVLAYLWPIMDNCTVIAKQEVFYLQPFGLAAWLWGTIYINRVKSKDAQEAVNKTGEIIRKRKARVLIFPEGTRNLGKPKLLPFKKGGFHLALASQVPLQPVVVTPYKFLKNFSFESGDVKIKILPQIRTSGRRKDDIQDLIDESYKIMSEGVASLTSGDHQQVNGFSNGKKTD
ncbi:1-acyl-sn-glycerol-3-phosphate acyltransferase alpha [Sitophilus oryzae]|uniref:1-acyl-sn-glycerol-3-phosphate acyltransferase n=1 Tax=Sitophilus oryzae TaxID=7048 RepID=A0A6J2YWN1_SITOR|nr:1-acyl-sn-glycerol-3-phosphate acyltransferase alpha [Sitophilus oryzae]XP_030767659.1 1-acyl-sn-glycerol-3-phosphate acyltransferase alpha [Sitophilus oryzae]